MSRTSAVTVAGVDVGGAEKGFHAVLLRGSAFQSMKSTDPKKVAEWCQSQSVSVVAVDSPCRWSAAGNSRLAERELRIGDQTIQCFKTPTRDLAQGNPFYGWVFNGEKLYEALSGRLLMFDGLVKKVPAVIETFPHAVVCALRGEVVRIHRKSAQRRQALRDYGLNDNTLKNIDFIDAALCAVAAQCFAAGKHKSFGDQSEGMIVVPKV